MTKYINIRVTEKQFEIIYEFISREASHMDSGDSNFDKQVRKLDKKLTKIKLKYGGK